MGKGQNAKKRHKDFLEKEIGQEKEKKNPLKLNNHEFKQGREKLEEMIQTFNFDEDESEMKIVKPGQGGNVPGNLKIKKNDKKMTKNQKSHSKKMQKKAEKYQDMLEKKQINNIKKEIQKLK